MHDIQPGQGLGPFILGTTLHTTFCFINDHRNLYPKDQYICPPSHQCSTHPSYIRLPLNGFTLHFDGPCQRLCLIEITNFAKAKAYYAGQVLPSSGSQEEEAAGPTYRHITQLFGPTFPGEYLPPHTDAAVAEGAYIISYPGVAVRFPVHSEAWAKASKSSTQSRDITSLLLSPTSTHPAQSLAIFSGESWPDVRSSLYSAPPPLSPNASLKPWLPIDPSDQVELARIYGEGRIQLVSQSGRGLWVTLSETTPLDLVSDLGAPERVLEKRDWRVGIHRTTSPRTSGAPTSSSGGANPSTSSQHTSSSNNSARDDPTAEDPNTEFFYSYPHHGLTVLISLPRPRSIPSPSMPESATRAGQQLCPAPSAQHLVATKLLIHGNVPGSVAFGAHRRLRWQLEHCRAFAAPSTANNPALDTPKAPPKLLKKAKAKAAAMRPEGSSASPPPPPPKDGIDVAGTAPSSEMLWTGPGGLQERLREVWRSAYSSEAEAERCWRGMWLDRAGDDGVGALEGSGVLVGRDVVDGAGEGDGVGVATAGAGDEDAETVPMSTASELFGFPGMIFEVLADGNVACLQVV